MNNSKATLTVREIRDTHTEQDIINIFEVKGIYNKIRDNKKSKNHGMLSIIDKRNSLYYFASYFAAYRYLLNNNGI
tara:strand:+ start:197 stop:424 length:228 start_codon:yes stop_codon:yes gene_type:complete